MGHRYEDLVVWQKAMLLAQQVYRISESFPDGERFGLTSQMRRAAVAVASNIAEGQGRNTKGEFVQFLGYARGSLFEIETQMKLAASMNFVDSASTEPVFALSAEVARLLNGLMVSMQERS